MKEVVMSLNIKACDIDFNVPVLFISKKSVESYRIFKNDVGGFVSAGIISDAIWSNTMSEHEFNAQLKNFNKDFKLVSFHSLKSYYKWLTRANINNVDDDSCYDVLIGDYMLVDDCDENHIYCYMNNRGMYKISAIDDDRFMVVSINNACHLKSTIKNNIADSIKESINVFKETHKQSRKMVDNKDNNLYKWFAFDTIDKFTDFIRENI